MIAGTDDGIVHEPRIELQRLQRRVADLEMALKVISIWASLRGSTGADARPDLVDCALRALYPERYQGGL